MILEDVIRHAVESPNHVAIVDDKRTLTYRELVMGANMFAGQLEELAPPPPRGEFGDKVGIMIPPTAAFVVAFGGTRWADRIALPLNYLLKAEELAAIVKDARLKVLFTIEYFRPLAEAVVAALGASGGTGLKVIFRESLKFERPGLGVMASLAMSAGNLRKHVRPLPPRGPDDVAVIVYTSGTAGVPKGVMLTNRNLESNALDSCRHAKFTEKSVFLGVLPMFHTFGLMVCMMIPMHLGSKVVYQSRFSAVGVFEAVKLHGVEVLAAVPSMFGVLAASKAAKGDSLAEVTHAISGGEALPARLYEQMKEKFGLELLEGYGLTETSPIVTMNVPWANKPGSVGRALPEVQLKTVDEAGKDLPPGVDGGELYIKGPNVMKGYYGQPELTAEVMTEPAPDGWLKTGDIARIDEEGYLFITGRKKDMIIMAGEKVFPREIEEALKQHPAVMLAAVIGVKDGARGEVPVAFVQLKPEAGLGSAGGGRPEAGELRAFVRERIAPYKVPKEVYFLDQLPMTPTGKVLKRALQAPAG
jgi:long-chain acyl-CoA synthetase